MKGENTWNTLQRSWEKSISFSRKERITINATIKRRDKRKSKRPFDNNKVWSNNEKKGRWGGRKEKVRRRKKAEAEAEREGEGGEEEGQNG